MAGGMTVTIRELAAELGLSRQRVHVLLRPYRDQLVPTVHGWRVPPSVVRTLTRRTRVVGRPRKPRAHG